MSKPDIKASVSECLAGYPSRLAQAVTDLLENTYRRGRDDGIDEAAEYIDDYSTGMGDEIRALKGGDK